ncbi:MAG: hypothetical protein N3A53_08940, partial [Verrucomicrobiae bacterium]|nr:hypothetical protein [Verrucomicrobiae bacterium]
FSWRVRPESTHESINQPGDSNPAGTEQYPSIDTEVLGSYSFAVMNLGRQPKRKVRSERSAFYFYFYRWRAPRALG